MWTLNRRTATAYAGFPGEQVQRSCTFAPGKPGLGCLIQGCLCRLRRRGLAAICWAPSAQRQCHPTEALYLPTFSHLLIVNKLDTNWVSFDLQSSIDVNKLLSPSLSPHMTCMYPLPHMPCMYPPPHYYYHLSPPAETLPRSLRMF